jgi:type II secretory ATPase GspE/PulE/Tfp pilus assembly ATPase PilB-like protein
VTNELDSLLASVGETSVRQTTPNETYAELLRQLLRDSLDRNASHIHLHCSSKELIIRYRILDKLQPRGTLPSEAADGLLDAIKSACQMDLLERRRPQEGRAIHRAEGGEQTIRVSVINAFHGPAAVLTWEEQDLKCREMHELGLLPDQEALFGRMLQHRVGFVVVSGNAWSGRRTLGHAALLAARNAGKEVISLEWGVSRLLPGILQCDFTSQSELTQLEWIQAALRQRPDVIFIEHPGNTDTIRDVITAARNRCLVIAAMGRPFEFLIEYLEWLTVPRCVSVETLLGVVEQRRLRTVCPNCTTYYTPKAPELRELRIRCANPERLSFAKGLGCLACRRSSRPAFVGVHEVATMTADLRDMFLQGTPTQAIRQHMLDCGMTTFYQSAVHKLVTHRISSATAVTCYRYSWREPNGWLDVDPHTGITKRIP